MATLCRRIHVPLKARPVNAAEESPDFTQLDDTALPRAREQMRAELQRLPPHSPGHAALTARYDASLDELVDALHNDALEADLYILRDQLQAQTDT
jgi:hypothetical protein